MKKKIKTIDELIVFIKGWIEYSRVRKNECFAEAKIEKIESRSKFLSDWAEAYRGQIFACNIILNELGIEEVDENVS